MVEDKHKIRTIQVGSLKLRLRDDGNRIFYQFLPPHALNVDPGEWYLWAEYRNSKFGYAAEAIATFLMEGASPGALGEIETVVTFKTPDGASHDTPQEARRHLAAWRASRQVEAIIGTLKASGDAPVDDEILRKVASLVSNRWDDIKAAVESAPQPARA